MVFRLRCFVVHHSRFTIRTQESRNDYKHGGATGLKSRKLAVRRYRLLTASACEYVRRTQPRRCSATAGHYPAPPGYSQDIPV